MRSSTGTWLIVIVAITILSLFMILTNPTIGDRQVVVRLGLDIQGGSRVLLAPDDPNVDPASVDQARQIISQRVNGLGVTEPLVQVVGGNRIVVELPDIKDPKTAIDTVQHTGLLEFVDFAPTGTCSAAMPSNGQYILTDKQQAAKAAVPTAQGTAAATASATGVATSAATVAATASAAQGTAAAAGATPQATAAATPAATATAPVPATGDGTQAHPFMNP